jgi:hypothetical protein
MKFPITIHSQQLEELNQLDNSKNKDIKINADKLEPKNNLSYKKQILKDVKDSM